ncbi:hypothetical protein Hanom_Chr09g00786931 [Helianthus anomalus]
MNNRYHISSNRYDRPIIFTYLPFHVRLHYFFLLPKMPFWSVYLVTILYTL